MNTLGDLLDHLERIAEEHGRELWLEEPDGLLLDIERSVEVVFDDFGEVLAVAIGRPE